MKIGTDTIIRTICLILALVNQGLAIAGISPLPIADEQVSDVVTLVITIVTSVWAWWKNNSFTKEALEGDALMHALKDGLPVEMQYGETEE